MRTLGVLFSLIISIACAAQTGYRLSFRIEGLSDTTVYLGYYYGESTFVRDTARVDKSGDFVFDGNQKLRQGVYFLVLDKTRILEFVVGEDQDFSLTTSTADYVKNAKVSGDPDNTLFFENMMFNVERHKEAEPYIKVLQDSTVGDDEKKDAREAFARINEKVMAYQDQLIANNPKTMTARLLKASKPIEIPEPPKNPDGSIDSTFQLRWYREHYFDNFNLSDEALIQLPRPLYQQKVNDYLDKLYLQHPDSVWKGIQFVVSKAKGTQETYKYAVWVCMLKYQQPEIMGLDGLYVKLYDTYFATGEMDFWANASLKKNLKEHADRLRNSLVGMQAPNLIMQDSDFKLRSMYDIPNKYTILYIFDPDCGACKKETPKLVAFYEKTKFDVEVYAVSADTSMAKMRNYIKEMNMKWITVNGPRTAVGPYQNLYDAPTTPTLYVMDEKKKIIAKKIGAEQLEDFLTQHERILKRREGKM